MLCDVWRSHTFIQIKYNLIHCVPFIAPIFKEMCKSCKIFTHLNSILQPSRQNYQPQQLGIPFEMHNFSAIQFLIVAREKKMLVCAHIKCLHRLLHRYINAEHCLQFQHCTERFSHCSLNGPSHSRFEIAWYIPIFCFRSIETKEYIDDTEELTKIVDEKKPCQIKCEKCVWMKVIDNGNFSFVILLFYMIFFSSTIFDLSTKNHVLHATNKIYFRIV